jgi:hypothetical protein
MPQLNDLSRSLVALDQDSTIIAVVELSQSSWLVAGVLETPASPAGVSLLASGIPLRVATPVPGVGSPLNRRDTRTER